MKKAMMAASFLAPAAAALASLASASASSGDVPAKSEHACTLRFDERGPHEWTSSYEAWVDENRNRSVLVRVAVPSGNGPFPIVLMSHGLGGSRDGLTYLSEQLASWGFIVVTMQHPGSDRSVWESKPRGARFRALAEAAADPRVAIDRFLDVPFVLDELEARIISGRIRGDIGRTAVVGHSFGAHSVFAAIGRSYKAQGRVVSFGDARVDSAVALSPPPPLNGMADEELAKLYDEVSVPVLHITGRQDTVPFEANLDPELRTRPFRVTSNPDDLLLVFEKADHNAFAGTKIRLDGTKAPAHYATVQHDVATAATVFLRKHLVADACASERTTPSGLRALLRSMVVIEPRE
ncbi:dienelactone hydrolase [Erythrobacter sp. NFXS35]|uniref:alpha/beta hydrolase family protein n=1 Tax=Erythrobacter sp. NFXS35 TaxID=2818436 RepID=UPI0032DEA05B